MILKKKTLQNDKANLGLGFHVITELIAGIAVGTLIGYTLDCWFSTRPFLMIIFLFLGAVAATMNIYRISKKY
ncbi:MAG: AtpZ/AtpI family protein, partial [Rhodospirillaceae bacterium]|jgi:ATP synthase protein I|nr:AtpZ/AtpI family protein [Rhodospirillaceae bacterium]